MKKTSKMLHSISDKGSIWSGALVVLGLVVEIWYAYTYRKGASELEIWLPAISTALVAVGVFFEVLFTHISKYFSDKEFAAINRLAAEARERAANAELQLEEMRQRFGPRQISRAEFLAALKPVNTPPLVFVQWSAHTPDGFSTALQLTNIFKDAGWNALGPSQLPSDSVYLQNPPQMAVTSGTDGSILSTGSGILVVCRDGEFFPDGNENPKTAIFNAVTKTLGGLSGRSDNTVPSGCIFLLVFGRL